MSEASPQATAQGSLSKTPFAHLVLYLYQHRSSGTLIVRDGTESDAFENKVLFHRGRAVAAHLELAATALDQALLPLCAARQGTFQFYERDLVGSGPSIVTGMFDPFAFVAEASRRSMPLEAAQEVLAKFVAVPLCLQPGMDLARLALTPNELALAAQLVDEPRTFESASARSGVDASTARRVLYVLLITKVIGPPPSEAPRSGPVPRAASAPTQRTAQTAAAPTPTPAPRLRPPTPAPYRGIGTPAARQPQTSGSSPAVAQRAATPPPAPRTATPSPAPRSDVAVPAPRSDAAVPAPRSDAAVPAPRSDAAVPAPRSDAVVPAPRSDAVVPAPRSDAAVPAPRSDAVVPAPRSDAPGTAARAATPSPRPPSERNRNSGAAWKAIASRAAEMASMRPSSGSRPVSRPLSPPPVDEQGNASRPLPARQSSGPVARPGSGQPRPPSRPLTPATSIDGDPSEPRVANDQSRPLTPGPFGSITPSSQPRVTPSSPVSRVTPRPTPLPVEALDADGKCKRIDQLCQRHAYDEALPIARALVEEDRKSAKYLGLLSHVLLGRSTDAIGKDIVDTVNQALRLNPDEPTALYTKARCYKRMGKEREALHYFRRTVAVVPNHIDATREIRLLLLRLSEKKGKR